MKTTKLPVMMADAPSKIRTGYLQNINQFVRIILFYSTLSLSPPSESVFAGATCLTAAIASHDVMCPAHTGFSAFYSSFWICDDKVVPCLSTTPSRPIVGPEVKIHAFLTSALEEGQWEAGYLQTTWKD
jgi:hypothetical protein